MVRLENNSEAIEVCENTDTDFKGIKKTRITGDIYRKRENKKQKKRAQHSHQLKSYSPYFQTNAVHSAQI